MDRATGCGLVALATIALWAALVAVYWQASR